MTIQEKWSSRELERQFKTALFERSILNPVKVTPVVSQSHPMALDIFRDAYFVEFLNLPDGHSGIKAQFSRIHLIQMAIGL
jgi:predicted nuclease of restriction endonuclease-like (RecB) superfamily